MRVFAIASLAAVTAAIFAGPAAAAAEVQVTIGPELQRKAERTYGVRDVQRLADQLRRDVSRELARTGAYDGARVELTLVDAVPNRPTFKQMGDRPGLSFESFGVGGARIEGRAVAADGTATPLSYRWYETDIRQAWPCATWSDAEWTFQRFAYRLGRGPVMARD